MKKLTIILFAVLWLTLMACGTETTQRETEQKLTDNQIFAYFVNAEETDIVLSVYTKKKTYNLSEEIDEIIQFLTQTENGTEYQSAIPAGITYKGNQYDEVQENVTLSFDILYDNVDAQSLLFFKACVSQSLLQLKELETVSIALTDVTNKNDETATIVESFDADSFAMSFGDDSGYKQSGTIVLYFANEEGTALKEYNQIIEISNNTSLARLVVEALIAGPDKEGYMETVSPNVTIRNLSVKDGICYVDLSEEFYDTENPLKNDIIIYSIVNSLVELPTVSKVQFLKDGEKQQFYRETMPFDGIFERNLDLIEKEENT